jgi:hypothetical protein
LVGDLVHALLAIGLAVVQAVARTCPAQHTRRILAILPQTAMGFLFLLPLFVHQIILFGPCLILSLALASVSLLISMVTAFRFNPVATVALVPDPQKGSMTVSPAFVYALMSRAR